MQALILRGGKGQENRNTSNRQAPIMLLLAQSLMKNSRKSPQACCFSGKCEGFFLDLDNSTLQNARKNAARQDSATQ